FFLWTDRTEFGLLSLVSAAYLFFNILLQESIGDFLIAKQSFVAHGIWNVLTSPVARIGSSIIVLFTHSIVLFVLFQVAYAFLFSLIGLSVLIKRYGLWGQYKTRNFDASCFRFGIRSLPVDVLGAFSNRLVEILIGTMFGLSNLAYFSVARDLRNQIANLLKISFPLFYADFATRPLEGLTSLVKKQMTRMVAASTLLGGLGIFAGIVYIFLFLPQEFHAAVPLLAILGLAFPVGIPTVILSTVLQSHLRYRAIAVATTIPNAIEVVLILLLGWFFGINGMIFAVAIFGYVSFTFFYLATVKRESFKKFLEQRKLFRVIMNHY
ncbi:MAG: oligosaccharide flippase family protein, partial [Candidatus Uhrbacteria bacterium]|nr:oligosaccharide flippase family protein [Candidatus Uhrbacteria bacterium]